MLALRVFIDNYRRILRERLFIQGAEHCELGEGGKGKGWSDLTTRSGSQREKIVCNFAYVSIQPDKIQIKKNLKTIASNENALGNGQKV